MNCKQMLIGIPTLLILATLTACTGGSGGGSAASPELTLFAGNLDGIGHTDGSGMAARFNNPTGIATDSAGNIYVADTGNNTIRKITVAGEVSTLAGTAGDVGSADGSGAAANFYYPQGIATDSNGNIYVADIFNHTIRKITQGGLVTTFAGTAGSIGSTDAAGASARFNFPRGIATDSADNIYVADSLNHTIRKITPAGVVSTLAGTALTSGSTDATGAAASFNNLRGVATDSANNVYVADSYNHTIRKITPAGVVSTLAGTALASGSTDATGAAARFTSPQGIVIDTAGNVYVADSYNQTIRKITPAGVVSTLAGTALASGSTDATGAAARFTSPQGVVTDTAGNIYVADSLNHTIRKITSAGVVSTFAGTAASFGSAEGMGAAARFNSLRGVASDSAGNVYVAEKQNHTISKITSAGVVSTFAGTAGSVGSADANGVAARFNGPESVSTDSAGNVYVADTYNHTIRKITADGVVSTLAGTAGSVGSTDAIGAAARFNYPRSVATDSAGNVYVADTDNHTIRKITAGGVVSTLAGTAGSVGGTDAIGAAARFNSPENIAIDSAGNVYVADTQNHTIRKITPSGSVSTVVGAAGKAGFVSGALPGGIMYPVGVVVSAASLYITMDNGVAVVRNLP